MNLPMGVKDRCNFKETKKKDTTEFVFFIFIYWELDSRGSSESCVVVSVPSLQVTSVFIIT